MSDDTSTRRIKLELERDTRDIAELWKDAIRNYKGITGVALLPEFDSVNDMLKFGTDQMNAFHKYRHDQKKVDRLRTLFMEGMGYIELGGEQLICAASAAFPPAAAIGTALTILLKACKQVSADYDVVTAFFEDMNAFLQRITILESRLPDYPAYRNCLMDVFTSFLQMCAFATKYIELGRFKKWIIGVAKLGAETGELAGARKNMDTSISRLQSATEFAILGNTQELRSMNTDLQLNQEMQTRIMQSQTTMLETVIESQQDVRNDLMNIQKLLVVYEERYREDSERHPAKSSARKKPATANRVRSFVGEMIDPQYEYDHIKDSLVADASVWPFQEPGWGAWAFQNAKEKGQSPPRILTISGLPGTGKSHLAVAAHDHLTKLADQNPHDNICVAHYYFRETTAGFDALVYAIKWIAVQVAEQSPSLCEKINAEIARDDLNVWGWSYQDWWTNLVEPLFSSSAEERLYVVWDGLDELNEEEQNKTLDFFKTVRDATKLNVRFLCTSRPETSARLEELGARTITITPEKQASDLKAVIWSHLNGDGALHKLNRYIKQRIATALEEKSKNLLYAEHMLRLFETTGREPLILKVLNSNMPETLQNLYESMLSDLQDRLRSDQRLSMRILLCWMAYSHRQLTVDEYVALLKLFSGDSFDLERDLQDRYLSRFLRIADSEERIPSVSSQVTKASLDLPDSSESTYDDGDLPLKFQGRSLREFFRSAKASEVSLRTPAVEAQRRIFVFCSRTLCGVLKNVHPGLQQYAADKWRSHLGSLHKIDPENMSEHDQVNIVKSMSALINDQPTAAAAMETLCTVSPYQFYRKDDLTIYAHFAKMALSLGDKISATTRKWAERVVVDQSTAYLPLARGHIANWFQAKDLKSAWRSYRFARAAIKTSSMVSLINDTIIDSKINNDGWAFREEEILDIFGAFEDIPKNAHAHRAVAILLNYCGYHQTALKHVDLAINLGSGDIFAIEATLLSIQISLSLELWDRARDLVRSTLNASVTKLPPNLLRQYFVARAQAESGAGDLDLAIKSYAEAEKADQQEPMPGDLLHEELDVIQRKDDPSEVISAIRSWKPMERLAWMTWDYYDSMGWFHEDFRRAAGRCGQQDFMVRSYQEVINLLDRLDSSAPFKYELSLAHLRVRGDIDAAKSLLNDILDKPSAGQLYALTNEDPANILGCAINFMASLTYEQFRRTRDPIIKMSLYLETKELTQKKMAQSIPVSKVGLLHHSLIVSRMARKMVGSQEFYNVLNNTFDACYEALTDKVGWNDQDVFLTLGIVLSRLEGLEEEARIAMSCTFAKLDTSDQDEQKDSKPDHTNASHPESNVNPEDKSNHKHGEEAAGSEDDKDGSVEEDDEASSEDEGDLVVDAELLCDGECYPSFQWECWRGKTLYLCLTCDKVVLCESCHAKRLSYNRGAESHVGATYCGTNHEYIMGPIEGWRGIKDGIMRIEGREPVKFRDWLDDLKDRKWKEAWERFWLAED